MGRQNWRTPRPVFENLNRWYGPFDLDAAADDDNHLCPKYLTERDDGLSRDWHGRVFINIPFGDPMPWVRKAIAEVISGRAKEVVMLCCANISAEWFHEAWKHAMLLIPTKRIAYWHPDEEPGSFDRDSAVFVFSGPGGRALQWECPPHAQSNKTQWQESAGQQSFPLGTLL